MMDLAAALSPTAEERARRCREYLEALEEERRKIQVFQRELPLSLHLVTQAIENYRQQMAAELMLADGCAVRSELEEEAEEMSGEGAPVLEEFIPIKRSCSSEDEEEAGDRRQDDHQHSSNGGHNDEDSCSSRRRQKQQETSSEKRPDWLMSVQLWSQHRDSSPLLSEEEHAAVEINPLRPSVAVEGKKATGAFHPFHPQKRSLPPPAASALVEAAPVPAPAPAVPATSSTSDTRGGGGRGGSGGGGGKSGCSGGDEKDGQHHRKARRCWSPELHRRFLSALQQLGGSDVATPKRIRELMKVDGLTNDEVKSHLQKYRLHSRRPSPTSHANSGSPPPQQVVFVGGIWVPPPEYAAAASAAAAAAAARPPSEGIPPGPPSGIYAPIASVPAPKQQQQPQQQQQQKKQVKQQQQQPRWSPGGRDEQCVADAAATRSHSAAPSSSSRTTTSGSPGRGR